MQPLRELGPAIDTFAMIPVEDLRHPAHGPSAAPGFGAPATGSPSSTSRPRRSTRSSRLWARRSGSPLLSVELRQLGGAVADESPEPRRGRGDRRRLRFSTPSAWSSTPTRETSSRRASPRFFKYRARPVGRGTPATSTSPTAPIDGESLHPPDTYRGLQWREPPMTRPNSFARNPRPSARGPRPPPPPPPPPPRRARRPFLCVKPTCSLNWPAVTGPALRRARLPASWFRLQLRRRSAPPGRRRRAHQTRSPTHSSHCPLPPLEEVVAGPGRSRHHPSRRGSLRRHGCKASPPGRSDLLPARGRGDPSAPLALNTRPVAGELAWEGLQDRAHRRTARLSTRPTVEAARPRSSRPPPSTGSTSRATRSGAPRWRRRSNATGLASRSSTAAVHWLSHGRPARHDRRTRSGEVVERVPTVVVVHLEAINHCLETRAEVRAVVPRDALVPEDGETSIR